VEVAEGLREEVLTLKAGLAEAAAIANAQLARAEALQSEAAVARGEAKAARAEAAAAQGEAEAAHAKAAAARSEAEEAHAGVESAAARWQAAAAGTAPSASLAAAGAREARYWGLQPLPFDRAELTQLEAKWLDPAEVEGHRESTTRRGGTRVVATRKRMRPLLERTQPQLAPLLELLRGGGGGGGGGGSQEAAGKGDDGAAPGPVAAQLLWWLRCLELWLARACEGMPAFFEMGGGGGEASEVQEAPPECRRGVTMRPADAVATALATEGAAICWEVAGGAPRAAQRVKQEPR
jgi:hypothetical protein